MGLLRARERPDWAAAVLSGNGWLRRLLASPLRLLGLVNQLHPPPPGRLRPHRRQQTCHRLRASYTMQVPHRQMKSQRCSGLVPGPAVWYLWQPPLQRHALQARLYLRELLSLRLQPPVTARAALQEAPAKMVSLAPNGVAALSTCLYVAFACWPVVTTHVTASLRVCWRVALLLR